MVPWHRKGMRRETGLTAHTAGHVGEKVTPTWQTEFPGKSLEGRAQDSFIFVFFKQRMPDMRKCITVSI